jgi:hypothetical protein
VGASAVDLVTSAVVGGAVQSTLGGTVLATTQAANDNSTKLATTAYADRAASGGGGATWTKVTKTFSDLSSVGSSSNTINLGSALPAKSFIISAVIKTSTAFSGGTLSTYTLAVGWTGNNTALITTYDAMFAVSNTNFTWDGGVGGPPGTFATTNLTLTASCSGDTLDHANAGSVDVWILSAPVMP